MNEILSQLQEVATTAVSMAIVSVIVLGWSAIKAYISAKITQVQSQTKDEGLKRLLSGVKDICADVSASYDPIVEKLKAASADGKLTEEEINTIQNEARDSSFSIVKNLFTLDTMEKLGITEETIKDLIAKNIESSVQQRKLLKGPNVTVAQEMVEKLK